MTDKEIFDDQYEDIKRLKDELSAKQKEIDNLQTVMIAAAEEIQSQWQAHCDEDGYGPANLMHRLEKGIPAQYGYTAGAFEKLQSRITELEAQLEELKNPKSPIEYTIEATNEDKTVHILAKVNGIPGSTGNLSSYHCRQLTLCGNPRQDGLCSNCGGYL